MAPEHPDRFRQSSFLREATRKAFIWAEWEPRCSHTEGFQPLPCRPQSASSLDTKALTPGSRCSKHPT